jgi:hypothetical protein
MIIHKQSEKYKGRTVCGYYNLPFPNVMTKKWNKVTCQNCKRLMASNEKTFAKYYQKCPHHVWGKELDNGQIKYMSYCTYKKFGRCLRKECPILNEGE